jgi:hypothetical protein
MGPSQICGCPFREPRVFEIAHIYIYTTPICEILSAFFSQLNCWSCVWVGTLIFVTIRWTWGMYPPVSQIWNMPSFEADFPREIHGFHEISISIMLHLYGHGWWPMDPFPVSGSSHDLPGTSLVQPWRAARWRTHGLLPDVFSSTLNGLIGTIGQSWWFCR